jgi:hypothetical protein
MKQPSNLVLAAAVACGAAAAQSVWLPRQGNAPPARFITGLAHDAARGRTVLFGGRSGTTYFNDTWEWDGATWVQRQPAVSPGPRQGHAMVYDLRRQRVVLVGGLPTTPLAETWEWDGTNWQQRTTPVAPPGRQQFHLAYDLARGRTVLFSGASQPNDTWEYDGTTWVRLQPAVSPPARCCGAFAYDVRAGRCILFGGYASTNRDDTWEWDGTTWTQRFPAHRPPVRCCNSLAYDLTRGRLVLFGGAVSPSAGTDGNDLWEWDGSDWLERRPQLQPSARRAYGLAFHVPSARTLLFGGGVGGSGNPTHGDTWEYVSGLAGAFGAFGAGCPGSAGTPLLAPAPGQLPWLNENFVLELRSLPAAATLAFGILGGSRTAWGSLPLPLDLAAIGMPGCRLHASLDVALPLASSAGVASWTLPIPNDPSLHGATVYVQGGVADPAANALGVTMANAGEVTPALR